MPRSNDRDLDHGPTRADRWLALVARALAALLEDDQIGEPIPLPARATAHRDRAPRRARP